MKFRAVALNRLDGQTIDQIRIWRNQDFVRKNMFHPHIITEEEHIRYIEKMKKDENRELFVFYLDGDPFGIFQYELYPDERAVVSGSYLIDENYQVMGYGAIMHYMINQIICYYLDVDTIYAEVIDINKSAQKSMKRFRTEPDTILKDHIIIDGIAHDVYRYNLPVVLLDKESQIGKVTMAMITPEPLEDMVLM